MSKVITNKSDKWAAIAADRVVYTARQPFKLAPNGSKGCEAELTDEQAEQLQAMIDEDKESENPRGLDEIFEIKEVADEGEEGSGEPDEPAGDEGE